MCGTANADGGAKGASHLRRRCCFLGTIEFLILVDGWAHSLVAVCSAGRSSIYQGYMGRVRNGNIARVLLDDVSYWLAVNNLADLLNTSRNIHVYNNSYRQFRVVVYM